MSRLAFFLGVALLVQSCLAVRDVWRSDGAPQQLSCSELLAQGPGENAHVRLTDCRVCTSSVTEEVNASGSTERFWIPLAPVAGECPDALHPLRALDGLEGKNQARLVLGEPASRLALEQLEPGPAIQGMVRGRLEIMPSGVKDRLYGASYEFLGKLPDGWVIERGRSPKGWALIGLQLLGGLVMLAMSLWLTTGKRE